MPTIPNEAMKCMLKYTKSGEIGGRGGLNSPLPHYLRYIIKKEAPKLQSEASEILSENPKFSGEACLFY